MTDNKKTKEMSHGSKVKKVITTVVFYLCKCIIEILIEIAIETLIEIVIKYLIN